MVLSLTSRPNSSRLGRMFALVLALCAFALLAGCAGTRGGPIPYNVENFGRPDEPTVLALDEGYKIASADTLTINVFQVPDLSGDFPVDLTGMISLPLLGSMNVAGLTTAELDRRLTQQLGAKYLRNPDVSVGLKSSARRNITLAGSVRAPGLYPVNGPLTLVQAIALGRGPDENANPRRVAIVRTIGGKRQGAAFDLVSIQRGKMDDPQVYSGDTVIVDGSNVRAIQREILTALPILGIFNPF